MQHHPLRYTAGKDVDLLTVTQILQVARRIRRRPAGTFVALPAIHDLYFPDRLSRQAPLGWPPRPGGHFCLHSRCRRWTIAVARRGLNPTGQSQAQRLGWRAFFAFFPTGVTFA